MPEACRPNLHWIKGHQDDKVPYEKLSLPAQLNVDADNLADQYILDFPDQDYNVVPILPTSGVQLQLKEATVTRNIKQEVMQARHVQPLIDYMMDKFEWSQETYDSVDWVTHRRAVGRWEKRRTTIIKQIYRWLPVGKQVHRYDQKNNPGCSTCQAPLEDQAHPVQCNAPTRMQWRKEFLSNVKKKMESLDFPYALIELFIEGLYSAIYSHSEYTVPVAVPRQTEDIAASQEAIGWKQLLHGRCSKLWKKHLNDYFGDRKGKSDGASSCMTELMAYIFEEWFRMWDRRNEDRHGADAAARSQQQRAQALREIIYYYNFKDRLPAPLRWLLEPPIEERLEWPTYSLRTWLNSYGPVIDKAIKDNQLTG
jgi:hypothetical protein